MKRILLCTAFLLFTSLCGHLAHADGTYTPSVTLVSPASNASYPIQYQSDGSYTAAIPVSVTNQFVQISGGTPSRTVYVGWSMLIKMTMYYNGSPMGGGYLASDTSNGLIAVSSDANGNWKRGINGSSSGAFSQTLEEPYATSWTIDVGSGIQDPAGNDNVTILENAFTTYYLYYG